jgi:hypothetical protein
MSTSGSEESVDILPETIECSPADRQLLPGYVCTGIGAFLETAYTSVGNRNPNPVEMTIFDVQPDRCILAGGLAGTLLRYIQYDY